MRAARKRLGLTLSEAARQVGVDKALLSRIESRERTSISFSTAIAICRALGLSLDDLAGLSRPK